MIAAPLKPVEPTGRMLIHIWKGFVENLIFVLMYVLICCSVMYGMIRYGCVWCQLSVLFEGNGNVWNHWPSITKVNSSLHELHCNKVKLKWGELIFIPLKLLMCVLCLSSRCVMRKLGSQELWPQIHQIMIILHNKLNLPLTRNLAIKVLSSRGRQKRYGFILQWLLSIELYSILFYPRELTRIYLKASTIFYVSGGVLDKLYHHSFTSQYVNRVVKMYTDSICSFEW